MGGGYDKAGVRCDWTCGLMLGPFARFRVGGLAEVVLSLLQDGRNIGDVLITIVTFSVGRL